jgi:hypothetical protein
LQNYALLSSIISIYLVLIYTSSVASDWISIQKDGIADKAAAVFLLRFATKNGLAYSYQATDRSERIGKKPHEADPSYTTVRTGLSKFFSVRKYGKKAKGGKRREREYPDNSWPPKAQ